MIKRLILIVSVTVLSCISVYAGEIITVSGESIKSDNISIVEKDNKLFVAYYRKAPAPPISCDDVVRINISPISEHSEHNVKITFTNGDCIYGLLQKSGDGYVSIASKIFGEEIRIKNDYIQSLSFLVNSKALPSKLPKAEDSDILVLA